MMNKASIWFTADFYVFVETDRLRRYNLIRGAFPNKSRFHLQQYFLMIYGVAGFS